MENLKVTIQNTNNKHEKILVIHQYDDAGKPILQLAIQSTLANYIKKLIDEDQQEQALRNSFAEIK